MLKRLFVNLAWPLSIAGALTEINGMQFSRHPKSVRLSDPLSVKRRKTNGLSAIKALNLKQRFASN
jgi:hypothetical protein